MDDSDRRLGAAALLSNPKYLNTSRRESANGGLSRLTIYIISREILIITLGMITGRERFTLDMKQMNK